MDMTILTLETFEVIFKSAVDELVASLGTYIHVFAKRVCCRNKQTTKIILITAQSITYEVMNACPFIVLYNYLRLLSIYNLIDQVGRTHTNI